MSASLPVRVLVADDHDGVLAALVAALESDARVEVVQAVSSADEAMHAVQRTAVDVALVDVHMPGGGAALARQLRALSTPPIVVAVSAHSGPRVVEEMIRAGATGYLTKGHAGERLVDLLCCCAAGEVVLASPLAAEALAGTLTDLAE